MVRKIRYLFSQILITCSRLSTKLKWSPQTKSKISFTVLSHNRMSSALRRGDIVADEVYPRRDYC